MAEEDEGIGDILDDNGPVELAAPEEVKTEPTATEGSEGTTQEASKTGDTKAAPPADDATDQEAGNPDGRVPVAALTEERRKRQESQRENEALRAAIQVQHQAPKPQEQTPQDPKDFLDGPEEWAQGIQNTIQEHLASVDQRIQNSRLDSSEASARSRHSDFQEAYDAFKEGVGKSPVLYQQMLQHHDPGQFVYDSGKMFISTKGIGSMAELKAQIRSELEAEAKSKLATDTASLTPKSLAGARGASLDVGGDGDESLADILAN